MARFLTTRGTTSEIETIINNAKNGVVLISPFISIPDSLFQNLIAADQRGIKTTILYGKKELGTDVREQLNQLKNVRLYFLENLHAKCYFNEKSMVITSLNLYDFSEQSNREMGVLITRQADESVFNEAIREARMMVSLATRSSLNIQVSEQLKEQKRSKSATTDAETGSISFRDLSDIISKVFGTYHGYCIGCRTEIDYDEYRPYCPGCYKKWSQQKSQKANYCHSCGRPSATSIYKPLCRPCFDESLE